MRCDVGVTSGRDGVLARGHFSWLQLLSPKQGRHDVAWMCCSSVPARFEQCFRCVTKQTVTHLL